MVDKNIIIDDGKIVGFTNDVPASDNKIDGNGLVSVPGPIDTHVHYGVYSPINRAAKTESHAAAIGGVTTMMRMLRWEIRSPVLYSLNLILHPKIIMLIMQFMLLFSLNNKSREMNFCVSKGIRSFKIYMNLGGEVGHVYMDMPPDSSALVAAQVDVTDETS